MCKCGVGSMGIKFIMKKKSELAGTNCSSDIKTTVNKDGHVEIVSKNFTMTTNQQAKKDTEDTSAPTWTCWGCGHVNTADTCEVCGKKRVQK